MTKFVRLTEPPFGRPNETGAMVNCYFKIVLSLHIFISYALKSINNTHAKRAGIYAGKKKKKSILLNGQILLAEKKKKHCQFVGPN